MKITIESPSPGEEDEIIIRCASPDDNILKLIYALKNNPGKITGYHEDKLIMLALKDIYYFDAVDNKVFAYTQNEVFEVRKKLYELETDYASSDFLRIAKSTIVNLSKIAYLKPNFNGRFEAVLKNKEKLIISRQYVNELKKKLGI